MLNQEPMMACEKSQASTGKPRTHDWPKHKKVAEHVARLHADISSSGAKQLASVQGLFCACRHCMRMVLRQPSLTLFHTR